MVYINKYKNIFYYYQRKYNGANENELEDLICEFLPRSSFQSSIYLDIFSNEINNLVSKTKHYSSLYKFLNN